MKLRKLLKTRFRKSGSRGRASGNSFGRDAIRRSPRKSDGRGCKFNRKRNQARHNFFQLQGTEAKSRRYAVAGSVERLPGVRPLVSRNGKWKSGADSRSRYLAAAAEDVAAELRAAEVSRQRARLTAQPALLRQALDAGPEAAAVADLPRR